MRCEGEERMHYFTLTTKIVKTRHVTHVIVDQETIIMEATSQTYFSLNAIGAKIWSLFNIDPLTVIDLANYLKKEFHLEEEKSIQDAHQFVECLLANNLISILD
jgi:hypothetical protein